MESRALTFTSCHTDIVCTTVKEIARTNAYLQMHSSCRLIERWPWCWLEPTIRSNSRGCLVCLNVSYASSRNHCKSFAWDIQTQQYWVSPSLDECPYESLIRMQGRPKCHLNMLKKLKCFLWGKKNYRVQKCHLNMLKNSSAFHEGKRNYKVQTKLTNKVCFISSIKHPGSPDTIARS